MEPLTFHNHEDIKVKIGKEGKEITIPRMKHGNAKEVIAIIAGILADDNGMAIETEGAKVRANIDYSKKSYQEYADMVRDVIPKLMQSKNFDVINRLLKKISEGAIGEKELSLMQFEEAAKLTAYLVERNFEALKNLSASLQAISSSVK